MSETILNPNQVDGKANLTGGNSFTGTQIVSVPNGTDNVQLLETTTNSHTAISQTPAGPVFTSNSTNANIVFNNVNLLKRCYTLSSFPAALDTNTNYQATLNGSVSITLPTPTNTAFENVINILLNITAAITIDWGVNANVAMTTFATGKYLIRLRYNNNSSQWIGEVLKGENTVSPVKLLLHFDGIATDSSANPVSLTANTDSNFPVYGAGYFSNTQAIRCYTNKYFLPSSTNNKLNLGSGDFTVSFWFKKEKAASNLQNDHVIYLDNNNRISPISLKLTGGGVGIDPSNFPAENKWYFITFTRKSGTAYYFIDGYYKAKNTSSNGNFDFSANTVQIAQGYYQPASPDWQYTYFQDFVIKDTCDYVVDGITATGTKIFDVPTAPYTIVETSMRDLHDDTKQNVLTSVTGYDASKTQVLKNVQGVLTWVDEAV